MKRYIIHFPFRIDRFELETWEHPVHNHSYFEIIFICKGAGMHNLNGNTYKYAAGDIYLLGPEDFHDFTIEQKTEFCFIRFNESFNKKYLTKNSSKWQEIIGTLLYTSSQSRGSIVKSKEEKDKLFKLLFVLESEHENTKSKYLEMVRDSLMQSILTILARNLEGDGNKIISTMPDSIEHIFMYVKQNIYCPSKLTIESIAEAFHISPTYVSIFFKKQTGESLKQYIIKHKIKLIEIRLIYSKLTLSEIAFEFGFTDESHFCKQFKKFTGSTPSAFRKEG